MFNSPERLVWLAVLQDLVLSLVTNLAVSTNVGDRAALVAAMVGMNKR